MEFHKNILQPAPRGHEGTISPSLFQEHNRYSWKHESTLATRATRCLLGINTREKKQVGAGVARGGITMQACLSYGAIAG